MSKRKRRRKATPTTNAQMRPDWTKHCIVCGATPIVPLTDMCGPCTFGEADTALGGWYDEGERE